ncbi:MAG: M16 family metallopeptidase, partial [Streptosporangiaceae bacterium]
PARELAVVKKYFGDIPRQPAPPAVDMSQPPQTGERRQTVTDSFARLPRLDIAYRIPAGNTPDWYALSMLGNILAGGRASRLYQELVQQKQLAVSIFGGAGQTRGPGLFQLSSTPRPGKPVAELEQAIETDLAQVDESGVKPEEMERVLMQLQTASIGQLQSTLGRAILVGTYAVYFHQPELINTALDRYRAVTAADIQRVGRQYFPAANRTVVITLPAPNVMSSRLRRLP